MDDALLETGILRERRPLAHYASVVTVALGFTIGSHYGSQAQQAMAPDARHIQLVKAPDKDTPPDDILPPAGRVVLAHLREYYPVLGRNQHAVILANISEESEFDPNAGIGTSFYGLCQWSRTRTRLLRAFAAAQRRKHNDLLTQIDFMMSEMGIDKKGGGNRKFPGFGHEAAAGRQLVSATSLTRANTAMYNYERYENRRGHRQKKRLNVATDMLAALGQRSGTPVYTATSPYRPSGEIQAINYLRQLDH